MMKVEGDQDLCDGKGAADVAGLSLVDHAQHLNAKLGRSPREIGDHLWSVPCAVRVN